MTEQELDDFMQKVKAFLDDAQPVERLTFLESITQDFCPLCGYDYPNDDIKCCYCQNDE